jgi:hypothetical protein
MINWKEAVKTYPGIVWERLNKNTKTSTRIAYFHVKSLGWTF